MNSLNIKKVVCLESDEEINRLREEQRRHERSSSSSSMLRDRLWREITVSATPERIQVHMGNVGEEDAKLGYTNVREACRTFHLTWPDLADVDGLEKLLQFETMVVAKKVMTILAHLREMSTEAHDMLAV
jgi:hypothetical protein